MPLKSPLTYNSSMLAISFAIVIKYLMRSNLREKESILDDDLRVSGPSSWFKGIWSIMLGKSQRQEDEAACYL